MIPYALLRLVPPLKMTRAPSTGPKTLRRTSTTQMSFSMSAGGMPSASEVAVTSPGRSADPMSLVINRPTSTSRGASP